MRIEVQRVGLRESPPGELKVVVVEAGVVYGAVLHVGVDLLRVELFAASAAGL